jgi:methylmalonyl-CoA/ethylmalonyl-CoA epimerase
MANTEPGDHTTIRKPRIAHIGVAVESLAATVPFFRDILGMPEVAMADSDGARIAAVQSGESLIEFLEPAGSEGPIARYIGRRGAGIHHICIAVPDLDAALENCRKSGVVLIDEQPRQGAEGKRIAFLHPRSSGGILVELTEE